MEQEAFDRMIYWIRQQHEQDLNSLIDYLTRTIPIINQYIKE